MEVRWTGRGISEGRSEVEQMSPEIRAPCRSTTRTRLRPDVTRAAEPRRRPARPDQKAPKPPRQKERVRKTDLGTILLHWILVITLTLSIGTGLRIAMDSPEHSWLVAFDRFLPLYTLWTLHIPAALTLFALSVAYAAYIWRGRPMRR